MHQLCVVGFLLFFCLFVVVVFFVVFFVCFLMKLEYQKFKFVILFWLAVLISFCVPMPV